MTTCLRCGEAAENSKQDACFPCLVAIVKELMRKNDCTHRHFRFSKAENKNMINKHCPDCGECLFPRKE